MLTQLCTTLVRLEECPQTSHLHCSLASSHTHTDCSRFHPFNLVDLKHCLPSYFTLLHLCHGAEKAKSSSRLEAQGNERELRLKGMLLLLGLCPHHLPQKTMISLSTQALPCRTLHTCLVLFGEYSVYFGYHCFMPFLNQSS